MSDSDTPALDAWNAKYTTLARMFQEAERLREKARHDEASALANAERKAAAKERAKWEAVVADKDARIAELEALLKKNQ